ncbi:helix-turn-helix transcriptional regulator [Mycobacteroides abscessus]|uniref:helix-turn-helix transcriptional regulator n=1 Tax=Mycobacteroides abscessus TaxID=36809 RepID=UPI00092ACBE7|nr:AraC family transcriptional regulator [Mycobacteroides abscessus]SHS95009.1 Probable transcriptional regulator, AraC family [Mycobacteroides abscessus subsp. abscessus]SHT89944.1 Probable transcriptional regulator, AraC family [Mycobacteroides abscessus subsp. abscessus]SHX42518.1 Probable transcriptional regulator, AraC family [Mycobacteroides abscessus subsp. abscessus]SIA80704.1 Probable transcriptional regulator, AraC family [Mycobacteroides abscessus subsp. abscessus]SIF21092.1 Probabl
MVFGGLGGVALGELQITFVSEPIVEPTEWYFDEPHHVVAVYQGGRILSKEIDFVDGLSRRYLPKVGDVLVVPMGSRAAITTQGERASFCRFDIPTRLLDQRDLQPRVAYSDPLILQLASRMYSVADRTDVIARLLRESLADVVRLHLSDHYAALRPRPERRRLLDSAMQARVTEYIEDGLDADISLSALAGHAQMSTSEFRKAFTEVFGHTPYQFVLDRRMSRAKQLLATTDLSVTDISVAVGFSSPSHFATTFKTRIGVTPTAYRSGV